MYVFAYAGVFLFGQDEDDFVTFTTAILKQWNMVRTNGIHLKPCTYRLASH